MGWGGHLGDSHLTLEGARGPGRAGCRSRRRLYPQNLRLELRGTGLWRWVLQVWRRGRDDILIKNTWVFLLKDHIDVHRLGGGALG